MTDLLCLEDAAFSAGPRPVLQDIDLAMAPGAALALLGANGAGKSTLLRGIMGLTPQSRGRLHLEGRDITALAPEARARLGLGYVPQGRRVFAPLSVRDNLLVAARASRVETADRLERVTALFPQLAPLMEREAWSLSGGEQQMLAIGRGLMGAPKLLLLDEPTLGLAPAVIADLYAALAAVRDAGTALVIAEQDSRHALALASHAVVLARGRIAFAGEAGEIAGDPRLAETMLGV